MWGLKVFKESKSENQKYKIKDKLDGIVLIVTTPIENADSLNDQWSDSQGSNLFTWI